MIGASASLVNNFKFESENLWNVWFSQTQKKVDGRAGTRLRKFVATRRVFWAWSQSSCRLFSEFLVSKRSTNFWFKFEVVFSAAVVDDHRTVLMEWWWCLVTCSRPQVVLERSCGCGWVGGLINGTHKCYNMIMMRVCVGERVGWENVPKIHQKLLKMSPISSDVVRRTCV